MTKREERETAAVAVFADRGRWEEPTSTITKSLGFFGFLEYFN
jgi:hypothetical protein